MTFSTSAVAVCCCSASVEIARARLHLVEQAHVLDRDHRLVGEGLHEFDLARRERPGLPAHQRENAFEFAVAQQGHAHASSDSSR